MTAATMISLGALAISLLMLVLTLRRDRKSEDARRDAAEKDSAEAVGTAVQFAKLDVKMDNILRITSDIQQKTNSMQLRVEALTERVAKVEASAASAHKRIDEYVHGGKE